VPNQIGYLQTTFNFMMVQTYVQRSCWDVVTERSFGRGGESCLMHPASCQQNETRQANRRKNTSGFGRRGFFMQLAEGVLILYYK